MLGQIDVDSLNDIFRVRHPHLEALIRRVDQLLQMFVLNRKYLGELHSFVTPVLRFVSYL